MEEEALKIDDTPCCCGSALFPPYASSSKTIPVYKPYPSSLIFHSHPHPPISPTPPSAYRRVREGRMELTFFVLSLLSTMAVGYHHHHQHNYQKVHFGGAQVNEELAILKGTDYKPIIFPFHPPTRRIFRTPTGRRRRSRSSRSHPHHPLPQSPPAARVHHRHHQTLRGGRKNHAVREHKAL